MSANFHIPEFLKHFRLNMVLISAMEQFPQWFRDGVRIASVYGVFPPALWNGGRTSLGTCDERTIKEVLNIYNSKGIPCRYTFTNPLITEKHLGDHFCNTLMRMGNNGLNEVIVNSPLLEDYIRKNYPNYKITSSTCKLIRNADDLKSELEKDYKLVVLDYNWNNDFEFLEQLPHKEKCELLINACCTPDCQRRGEHYRSIGEEHIRFNEYCSNPMLRTKPFEPKDFQCPSMRLNLYETTGFRTHISPELIYEKYIPMGFTHFKIEGRTTPDINVLENFVYYMVKPEFRDIARLTMLTRLTSKTKYFK